MYSQIYDRLLTSLRVMLGCLIDIDRSLNRISLENGDHLPHRESLV